MNEAREWIDFYLEPEPCDHHRWIMITKDNGEKIGTCGFHCYNKEIGYMEIGYDLRPTYWGRGYMTEALKCMLEYVKGEMCTHRIDAHISIDNTRSIRLCEKMGFIQTREQYNEVFHGVHYPHDVYRLILD